MATDTPVIHALRQLERGQDLTAAESAEAFEALMKGQGSPAQTGGLLMALRLKGETPAEVVGAARAVRAAMNTVAVSDGRAAVDTCGTGGGSVTTVNISTASAFVAVGAGVTVAKHGNRSFTSKCGSADVLEAIGVELPSDSVRAARILEDVGMVFLFAPYFHPAMKHVAPIRRELGVSTIMNIIGPLANPASVSRQVLGVFDRDRAPLMAHALLELGAEHAMVLHAKIGMDEISPVGETDVWEIRDGEVREWVLNPADYGLETEGLGPLAGGDVAHNARWLREILAGTTDAGREAVLLNAAAAIYVGNQAASLREATTVARESLDSGAGSDALERLVEASTSE